MNSIFSIVYTAFRCILSFINKYIIKDYETVVLYGHATLERSKMSSLCYDYSQNLGSLNITRQIFNLKFESPITFAAFESHLPSLEFWLKLGCGGGCIKTITLESRSGNPRPRLQQVKLNGQEHLINALGLPGVGVHALLQKVETSALVKVPCPIGISIGGHSLEDYKQTAEQVVPFLENHLTQPYIELNISCPNTDTGQSLHENIHDLEALLRFIRSKTDTVVVVKVSPDAPDAQLCDIAACVKAYSATTINAGNTQFKRCKDVGLKPSRVSIGGGGLSGPILFNRTLEMATLLSQFKLPLISTGGITSADHIIELQKHGVQVVGMATQLVKNPFLVMKMNRALRDS
jgi:dihydroorotate dehydrogenase